MTGGADHVAIEPMCLRPGAIEDALGYRFNSMA